MGIAADAIERMADQDLNRRAPIWTRWLVIGFLFLVALVFHPVPRWAQALVQIAWSCIVFSSTIGFVFGLYGRKLGDEDRGSHGSLVFSFVVFAIVPVVLLLLKAVTLQFSPSDAGVLLGLVLSIMDGWWAFFQRDRTKYDWSGFDDPGPSAAEIEARARKFEGLGRWAFRGVVLMLGAVTSLWVAVVLGAPFFVGRDSPHPWHAGWGVGFCAYAAVVSWLQAFEARTRGQG